MLAITESLSGSWLKKEALDGHTVSIFSQTFYPSWYGNSFCARAYLNWTGPGRGLNCPWTLVMRQESDRCCSGRSGIGWRWCLWTRVSKRTTLWRPSRPIPIAAALRDLMGRWSSPLVVLALWLIPLWRMPKAPPFKMTSSSWKWLWT